MFFGFLDDLLRYDTPPHRKHRGRSHLAGCIFQGNGKMCRVGNDHRCIADITQRFALL